MSLISVCFSPALRSRRPLGLDELLQLPTGVRICGKLGSGEYHAETPDGRHIRMFRIHWHWRRGSRVLGATTLWGGLSREDALSSFTKLRTEAISARIVEEVNP